MARSGAVGFFAERAPAGRAPSSGIYRSKGAVVALRKKFSVVIPLDILLASQRQHAICDLAPRVFIGQAGKLGGGGGFCNFSSRSAVSARLLNQQ